MKNRFCIAIVSFLLGVSLLASASSPKQSTEMLKARMQELFDAWSALDPAKAAPFYAKDADLDFYDIAPMKYTGWAEYAEGVKKEFGPYSSVKFVAGNDARVHQSGNTAWGTTTWHGEITKKDGTRQGFDGRYTCIWEKRGNQWLVVHEHMSIPMPVGE